MTDQVVDFTLGGEFCSPHPLARRSNSADQMEILSVSFCLTNTNTFTVLPDVTFLAGNAVCTIIDLSVGAADTVEYPICFLRKILKCLLLSLDFCFSAHVLKVDLLLDSDYSCSLSERFTSSCSV